MGYTTWFSGSIEVEPPLSKEENDYLMQFSLTRHMNRSKGQYYVDPVGADQFASQFEGDDIKDYNSPPSSQPGLWCQWIPTSDGKRIVWDDEGKFYEAPQWMAYLMEHFLKREPRAKRELPFLQGHSCNGLIEAQGEESEDRWAIRVVDNKVHFGRAHLVYPQWDEIESR